MHQPWPFGYVMVSYWVVLEPCNKSSAQSLTCFETNAVRPSSLDEYNVIEHVFFLVLEVRVHSMDPRPATCVDLRIKLSFKNFTVSNTHLEPVSEFPEMGTVYKASFMKSCLWWFTITAIDLSEKWPNEASSLKN